MIRKVRAHINKIWGLGMQGYIIRCEVGVTILPEQVTGLSWVYYRYDREYI